MNQAMVPSDLLHAIWPIVGPALTPPMVASLIVTISATHAVKILAEQWLSQVTDTPQRWRAFCTSASIGIGAAVGLFTWWLTPTGWAVVPLAAFLSGPAWLVLRRLAPARVRGVLLTDTDLRYRRERGKTA